MQPSVYRCTEAFTLTADFRPGGANGSADVRNSIAALRDVIEHRLPEPT